MVDIVLSRAGRLFDEGVKRTAAALDRGARVYWLVPSQYTLQTERELMDALNVKGFFDVEVLSPSRLTDRVFALTGGDERTRIDERGKAMAMAGALIRCAGKLRYYERAAQKQGFISRLSALVASLKRAEVTPDMLADCAESYKEGAAHDKLHDLALIYGAYEEILADRFVDGEDVQSKLILQLKDAALFENALLIIYGFDVMTGEMARLAIGAAKKAARVDVLLIDDPRDEAFSAVTESVQRFYRLLGAEDLPYQETFVQRALDAPPDIAALESGLLRLRAEPYFGAAGAVRLYAAPTPYAEAHFVAREILLLNRAGVPFGEMRVLVTDEKRYFGTLDTVLKSYLIPHYIAQKAPAGSAGVAAFVLCALRAAASGFRGEEMCAVLRTGYLDVSEDERFEMENFIAAFGIRGKLFLSPFTRGGTRGEQLEDAREKMVAPLAAFRASLKNAVDTDQTLMAVMTLLDDVKAAEKHRRDVEALENAGYQARAMQLNQVWKTLMRLLDQMHELLGGAHVSGAQAAKWLEAGLTESELSALPQAAGSVTCGVLGNAPLKKTKALFVMGLNDGALALSEGGLLSEDEQQEITDRLSAYLSINNDGREQLKRLDVVKAFATAKEKLFLSSAQALQDGTALRPLTLLNTAKRLLPSLIEEGGVTAPQDALLPLAIAPALASLGARLRKGGQDRYWMSAWRYICRNEPDKAQALIDAYQTKDQYSPLPKDLARQLFLERVSSVSRLETFAVCPFKHFVRYGLRPREKEEWTLEKRTIGTFYHDALEGFTRLLPSIPGWPNIEKKACDEAILQAAEGAVGDQMRRVMADSSRAAAAGARYQKLLKRVAWTFTKTAQQSAFRPEAAEVRFGFEDGLPPIRLTLDNGEHILLRGQIDRIDRYAGDEGVFLRVIDYKSGAAQLSPQRIFYGTQLQLLLYLMAALEGDGAAQPAGAFYFHVADPLLADEGLNGEIETKLAQALSLSGVTLRDAAVVRLMDSGEPPLSMPKLLTKEGEFAKNKQVATLDEMRLLISRAFDNAVTLAKGVAAGETKKAPLETAGEPSPCETCDYASICRRNAPDGGCEPRSAEKMRFDELLEKLKISNTNDF